MGIKDFEVGQTAYILNMHTGRNQDPEITKTTVEKVGRRYVTVDNGTRYEEGDDYGLIDAENYGERTYLCPSKTDADMHIERHELRVWLRKAADYSFRYDLEQLRKVKEILETS